MLQSIPRMDNVKTTRHDKQFRKPQAVIVSIPHIRLKEVQRALGSNYRRTELFTYVGDLVTVRSLTPVDEPLFLRSDLYDH